MHRSPLLSPSGEPVFVAGGANAWRVAEHRGYIVSLEWVTSQRSSKRAVPCMVIWPATGVTLPGVKAGMWAISRKAITEFVGFNREGKCTGSASEHCYREAQEALPMLGKDRWDKQAFLALVDCVVKFAPELVAMPVAPKIVRKSIEAAPMFEVTATNKSSGKVISEATV